MRQMQRFSLACFRRLANKSSRREPLAKIGMADGETRRCAGTQLCKSGIDRILIFCNALHQGRLGVIARLFFPHLCTWHAPGRAPFSNNGAKTEVIRDFCKRLHNFELGLKYARSSECASGVGTPREAFGPEIWLRASTTPIRHPDRVCE